METLSELCSSDVALYILEFLINDDDYSPFRLQDIMKLSSKIHKWKECIDWSEKTGNLEIFQYSRSKFKPHMVMCGEEIEEIYNTWGNWSICLSNVAHNGHLTIELLKNIKIPDKDIEECIMDIVNTNLCVDHTTCSDHDHDHGKYLKYINILASRYDNVWHHYWNSRMNDGFYLENLNLVKLAISKGASDFTSYLDLMDNLNIQILKYLGAHVKSLDANFWYNCALSGIRTMNVDLYRYALSKGVLDTNIEPCVSTSSTVDFMCLLCYILDNDDKLFQLEMVNITVPYIPDDKIKSWNVCLRVAVNNDDFDLITFCESKGANLIN